MPSDLIGCRELAIADDTETLRLGHESVHLDNSRTAVYGEIADDTEAIRLEPNEPRNDAMRGESFRNKREHDKVEADFCPTS